MGKAAAPAAISDTKCILHTLQFDFHENTQKRNFEYLEL